MRRRCTALLCCLLCLTGCATLAPPYETPAAASSNHWPAGAAYPKLADNTGPLAAHLPLEQVFPDQRLQQLLSLAIANNRDLRQAVIAIEQSRALFQIERAALLPQVDAEAQGYRERRPADLSGTGQSRITSEYRAGLGVSAYELDLFGRIRSLRDQALQTYLATEEARRAVHIGLVAEVASAWLTLAADQEHLRLARETLTSQEASYRLIQSRYDAGISSALDLHQAQTSVDNARIDIARYSRLVAQDQNALTLLVGSAIPANLLPEGLQDIRIAISEPAIGLPSQVLLQRPDILQAEHQLRAAYANIGAARAAFFPSIHLLGSFGSASAELTDLFQAGSLAWSFTPQISVPIFDAQRNRLRLRVAETERDLLLARYDKAIQTAFREVADALAAFGTLDTQLQAQRSLVDATANSYNLSQARYQQGIDSYLNVLDSQRALYRAQQELISTELGRQLNRTSLYRVLGGGWYTSEPS